MLVDDYLMRQVRKMAEAIANLANGSSGQSEEDIEVSLDEAYRSLLGLDRDLAGQLDAQTLLRMLPDAGAVTALAMLLKAHADLYARRGDQAGARLRRRRALDLLDDVGDAEAESLRAELERLL